jgi:hypothetical protein
MSDKKPFTLREARAAMKPGNKVRLDDSTETACEVWIVKIGSSRLFTIVRGKTGSPWIVMLNRLTPLDWKEAAK